VEITGFSQSDHVLDDGARRLGLRHRRLDPLGENQRGDQIAQQRPAVLGLPA